MEKTPLEIYETAYRLHYVEDKVSEAVPYYESLIKEFPESNECGYAAIQLQKIKSGNLVKELQKYRKGSPVIGILAFIIGLLSLAGSSLGCYFLYNKMIIDQKRATLAVSALGKMYRGEDDEALKVLTELKILAKEDITPFELSADIYRKRHQFDLAKSEYELFYRLNPNRQPSAAEMNLMKIDTQQQQVNKVASVQKTPHVEAVAPVVNKTASPEPEKSVPAAADSSVSQPEPKVAKQPLIKHKTASDRSSNRLNRTKTTVQSDSVSYF
jgi:tetratricopeptide (TPR) repeat protein